MRFETSDKNVAKFPAVHKGTGISAQIIAQFSSIISSWKEKVLIRANEITTWGEISKSCTVIGKARNCGKFNPLLHYNLTRQASQQKHSWFL